MTKSEIIPNEPWEIARQIYVHPTLAGRGLPQNFEMFLDELRPSMKEVKSVHPNLNTTMETPLADFRLYMLGRTKRDKQHPPWTRYNPAVEPDEYVIWFLRQWVSYIAKDG